MSKILLFGTFDILHPGHASLFKQARQTSAAPSQIIVVIARDVTVKQIKKHLPVNSEKKRRENLLKTGWANKALLGGAGDRYEVIKKIKPDFICLGYDQKIFTGRLRQKIKQFGLNTKIVRLKSFHPQKYKSSKLKKKI